ncbi:MAG: AI-2E family transporter [Armatimonadetes bacterium]|nr:AI-2E family transporter [Armatimonadota bacterium]
MSVVIRWRIGAIAVLVVFSFILLYRVREVLAPFIIAPICTYLLAPWVDSWSKKMPRALAVVAVYLSLLFALVLGGLLVIPQFMGEAKNIANEAPNYFHQVRRERLPKFIDSLKAAAAQNGLEIDVAKIMDNGIGSLMKAGEGLVAELPDKIRRVVTSIISTVTGTIVVLLLTAFLLIDLPKLRKGFLSLVPEEHKDSIIELVASMNKDLSSVIRGQLLICLVNGILTTVALLILRVKYAFTIGAIAGLFSLIPVLGSILSTIPAVLMGLTQSWTVAFIVLLVIIGIHLLESNFLNPKIMGESTELHPYVIMFALFAGERLFGIWGLLLGVPCAAILRTIIRFVRKVLFTLGPSREKEPFFAAEPPPKIEAETI